MTAVVDKDDFVFQVLLSPKNRAYSDEQGTDRLNLVVRGHHEGEPQGSAAPYLLSEKSTNRKAESWTSRK